MFIACFDAGKPGRSHVNVKMLSWIAYVCKVS